jgi:lycopene beta-cyclase
VKKADILILGAGCSGTSLAHYLEIYGYQGKVVLLDQRTKFDREQRWCSWAKIPESMKHLVSNSWKNWTVCNEYQSTTQTSEIYNYQEIYAPDFFDYFHSRWLKTKTQVDLKLGEKVLQIESFADFVKVTTENESWEANLVFDARHQGSDNFLTAKNSNAIHLNQTFLGWKVEFPNPVFDKETATLMDFHTTKDEGVNFMYVLPETDKTALVESTSFSSNFNNWGNHINSVTKYIEDNFGNDYVIKAEESGVLPMTTASFPSRINEKQYAIGVAGGSARSSSGYAFQRIQRQTSEIAMAIVSNEPIPDRVAPRKYRFFDAIFLEAIKRNPQIARDCFQLMFAKVPADSLIRFLQDESSISDDLKVVAALPKIAFGVAGMQSLWRNLLAKKAKYAKNRESNNALLNTLDNSARRLVARKVER